MTTTKRADVELRLPAESAYLSVLRTTAAGLAARLDFTMDDIEDLRIAVGEAGAMVLPEARQGSDLHCSFLMRPRELSVELRIDSDDPAPPPQDGFGWQVLTALTSSVRAEVDDSSVTLSLSRVSSAAD